MRATILWEYWSCKYEAGRLTAPTRPGSASANEAFVGIFRYAA
jgi:hypothetical protein